MYIWLRRYLAPNWAAVLAAAWYVLLATAVFLTWGGQDGMFYYIRP